MIDNQNIEKRAIMAVEKAFIDCPIVITRFTENDKGPSWDGSIEVYNSEKREKANLLGRIPIQIKGTTREKKGVYSLETSDLNNYRNEGGILFFCVFIDSKSHETEIYYSMLLTYEFNEIKDKIKKQDSYSIQLKQFPSDAKEIINICYTYLENCFKQIGFKDSEILSIEKLAQKDILRNLEFNISGKYCSKGSLIDRITSSSHYIYFKDPNTKATVSFDKVSKIILETKSNTVVTINDVIFYKEVTVIAESGKKYIMFGNNIRMSLSEGQMCYLSFNTFNGGVNQLFYDVCFISKLLDEKEFCLDGNTYKLLSCSENMVREVEEAKTLFTDIKKVLIYFSVKEDLRIESLSSMCKEELRILIDYVVYNKKIKLNNNYYPYKRLIIGNIAIDCWWKRDSIGNDCLYPFSSLEKKITLINPNNGEEICVPHYLLLQKESFIHSSNLDFKKIIFEIKKCDFSEFLLVRLIVFVDNILNAYDEHSETPDILLELSENIVDWLVDKISDEYYMVFANLIKCSIKERKGELSFQQKTFLFNIGETSPEIFYRCVAFLLLEEGQEAKKVYNSMSNKDKEEFQNYYFFRFVHCYSEFSKNLK